MRDELVKVVDLLIRKVELEKQNEQKSKELVNKSKDLSDLQIKYDMEVRSKEELVKDLNFFQDHAFGLGMCLEDFENEEKKQQLKKASYSLRNYLQFGGKLKMFVVHHHTNSYTPNKKEVKINFSEYSDNA